MDSLLKRKLRIYCYICYNLHYSNIFLFNLSQIDMFVFIINYSISLKSYYVEQFIYTEFRQKSPSSENKHSLIFYNYSMNNYILIP